MTKSNEETVALFELRKRLEENNIFNFIFLLYRDSSDGRYFFEIYDKGRENLLFSAKGKDRCESIKAVLIKVKEKFYGDEGI